MDTIGSRSLPEAAMRKALSATYLSVGFGLPVILMFALQFGWGQFASVLGVGLVTAGAALLGGALVGFLFGIPPMRNRASSSVPASSATPEPSHNLPEYAHNTNLEQISDWLTKILLGIGLANLGQIGNGLRRAVNFMAPGLGNVAASRDLALGLLLYYLALVGRSV
jgi:hypothetical protein